MSCHANEVIQENILMGVLDMDESDIIEELSPALIESKGLTTYDELVDELVKQRYSNHPDGYA